MGAPDRRAEDEGKLTISLMLDRCGRGHPSFQYMTPSLFPQMTNRLSPMDQFFSFFSGRQTSGQAKASPSSGVMLPAAKSAGKGVKGTRRYTVSPAFSLRG
jgi:hypothetical protein